MIVGYARTSTADQVAGFEAQKRQLQELGCERIFAEQVSSVAERPQLEALIEFVREGDVVTVTKMCRLARSMRDLMEIQGRLQAKGAQLRIIDGAIDTSTPTARLTLHLLAAVAQFEREMMLERQREGIQKAKADGKYKGRAPTVQKHSAEIRRMAGEGMSNAEIADRLGVNRVSVWRVLKAAA